MKKYLLAATALALVSGIGAASAADLPGRKGPPVAPVYVPPAFTWTGFYVGLNAGAGWSNNNHNNNNLPLGAIPVGGFFPGGGGNNNAGFVGGGQAGYNYQFGAGAGVVVGVEADIDYADIGHNRNNGVPFTFANTPGTTFFPGGGGGNSTGYIGTVRGRIGYAWDRFLVYGTGGLAYGDLGRRNNNGGFAITQPGFANPITGVVSAGTQTTTFGGNGGNSTNVGWTIGGGVEYAVWQNWTVKAEYLYYNLGNHKNNNNNVVFAGSNRHGDNDGSIVRVGVNYKFW